MSESDNLSYASELNELKIVDYVKVTQEEDTLKTIEETKEVELQEFKDSATSLVEEVIKKEDEKEVKITRLGSLYRLFCIFSRSDK